MATSIVSQSVCSSVPYPAQSTDDAPRSRASVYEIVTEQVIKQLESGVAPWRKPWRTEMPCNLLSQKPYRGLNVFLLASQGYASRYWLTFNQANKLGGKIKQGEHSSLVTFWHIGDEKTDSEGKKTRPFLLRYYRVFNLCQTVGIAEKLGLSESPRPVASIEQCEAIVAAMPNAPRMEQSNAAWYRPSTDAVGMPARGLFSSAEEYYSTLFHELTHSTGHASRIGREGIEQLNTFGSELYSKEELIAEMGAAMLCGVTGIAPATIQNSAAYLKTWIERLRSDSRLLVSAASAAQKAADYIRGESATSSEGEATDLAFPQSLAEKYRPVRIADFIGLDRPKKVLTAFCKRPASGAWLFVGPSGVGKSTMALALAAELQAELHKIPSQKCNAQTIDDTVRQCWYAPMTPGGFHVVLADEADQMTNAGQLCLLSKLDATDPAPNTIWIFTANDTERLERRFLSRCKVLEFSSYGLAEHIAAYLDRVWHAEGGNGNAPDLVRLAKDSRNNVRDCLMRLEVELMAL